MHNSWCKYIFYGCVTLLVPECVVSLLCVCVCVFVFVCVCVRSNQSTSKKLHHVSELSKLDVLLHKTCIKVLKLNMCTSMISLSKIAHQVWCDHPFSQRNKTAEWSVGWVLEVTGKGGWTKFEKGEGGRQYRVFFIK